MVCTLMKLKRAHEPAGGDDACHTKMLTRNSSSGLFVADFAALVAIFANVGLEGVNSDLAALLRTYVIIAVLGIFVCSTAEWQNRLELSTWTNVFLVLSALATGAS